MMKLRELLNGLDILETNAGLDSDIREVRYDSRLVESGDLFIAVTGAETDGHKYIPMAREKGAACVLCERAPEDGVPFVRPQMGGGNYTAENNTFLPLDKFTP